MISSDDIFPLVAPEGATLPLVIYKRTFNNSHTKDGYAGYDAIIDITVMAADYTKAIAICTAINTALEEAPHANGIRRIQLESGDEAYLEDCYAQNLVYAVKGV